MVGDFFMQTINGDLLTALEKGEIQCIGHQTNCMNAFGPIIAAKIKKKFPEAWWADCVFSKDHTPYEKLGKISYGELETGQYVLNLYAQLDFGSQSSGRKTNYESLYRALEVARDFMKEKYLTKIGFPFKMGSDRAGGDWRIVSSIIEVIFQDSGIDVTIYQLPS